MNLKYLFAVLKHKFFVFVECCKLGIPFLGLVHDMSKLRLSEWKPYANRFYGDKKSCLAFDIAWLHHQKRNKHHWQYWLLNKDSGEIGALPMPDKYIKEMVADWIGAGKAYKGDPVNTWYYKNRGKMTLNSKTKAKVEELLEFEDPQASLSFDIKG